MQLGLQPWLNTMYDVPRPRWRQRLQSAQNMIVKCHHLQHLQNLQLIDPDHPLVEGSCLVFVVFYWHIWLLETQRIDGIRSADAAFPLRGRYASHGGLPGRVRRYMEILCFTMLHCSHLFSWIRPTRLVSWNLKFWHSESHCFLAMLQWCSGLSGNAGRTYQLLPTSLHSAYTLHWDGNESFWVKVPSWRSK